MTSATKQPANSAGSTAGVRWFNGLFVGQLDEEEMKQFESDVKTGTAIRSYEGFAGILGMAKVRYIKATIS